MHKVGVGVDELAFRPQALDVDAAVLDALFVRQHNVGQRVPHVEGAGLHLVLAAFELCDVQHVLHEPRQTPGLLRNDGQVMLVLALGDRVVQHAVNKALDAGHRRAQLMRNVAHELAARVVDGLQPRRHVVEGCGKPGQLFAAVHRRAGGKVPAAQLARRRADLLDRRGDLARQQQRNDQRQQQDAQRRQADHADAVGQILVHRLGRGAHKQIGPGLPALHLPPGHIVFAAQHIAQRAALKIILAAVHTRQDSGGHRRAGQHVVVGAQHHLARAVRHEHRHVGRCVEQLKAFLNVAAQRFVVNGAGDVLPARGKAVAQGGGGVQHAGQRTVALLREIGHGKRAQHAAHQKQAGKQDQRRAGKDLPADALARLVLHGQSFTSNL